MLATLIVSGVDDCLFAASCLYMSGQFIILEREIDVLVEKEIGNLVDIFLLSGF
jgi:hypothetical protein